MRASCGYTIIDSDGDEQPCDRPATGWRWYQGHDHEDMLDEACERHENEGGRRMADWQARAEAAEAREAELQEQVAQARRWILNCVDAAVVGRERKSHMLARLAAEPTPVRVHAEDGAGDGWAKAWDRGYVAGHSNAMRRMSDEPNAPSSRNPYRPAPVADPKDGARIEETCCGKCPGACYVDQVTGA